MDYRDRPYSLCTQKRGKGVRELIGLLGSKNVRQVNQQLVMGRHWFQKQEFPSTGAVIAGFDCYDLPALHATYTVRSDYVIAIQDNYTSLNAFLQIV